MKKIFPWLAVAFGAIVVVLAGGIYFFAPQPPTEAKLRQTFNEHRAAFERLRDMLKADSNLTRVANWGIEIRQPFFIGKPPAEIFPANQYDKYLDLLTQVGGLAAARDEGEHPDIKITLWALGWGGKTRHMDICWMNQAPPNPMANLDGYPGGRSDPNKAEVFSRIDQNWYLRADW